MNNYNETKNKTNKQKPVMVLLTVCTPLLCVDSCKTFPVGLLHLYAYSMSLRVTKITDNQIEVHGIYVI